MGAILAISWGCGDGEMQWRVKNLAVWHLLPQMLVSCLPTLHTLAPTVGKVHYNGGAVSLGFPASEALNLK